MEDKRFDKMIDEIVRDFEANYSSDSWRRLERKLNAEEKDNEQFDKMIAYKFNFFSMLLDPGSFSKFEDKLQNRSLKKFNINVLKNIAAAIIFLLYAVEISNSDFNRPLTEDRNIFSKEEHLIKKTQSNDPQKIKQNNTIVEKSFVFAKKVDDEKVDAGVEENVLNISDQNFGIKYSHSFSKDNFFHFVNFSDFNNNRIEETFKDYDFVNPDYISERVFMHFEVYEIADNINSENYKNDLHIANNIIDNQANIKYTNSDNNTNKVDLPADDDMNTMEIKDNILEKKLNKTIGFSAYAAPSYAFISTPNDLEMGVPAYKNQTFGVETGFNFGFNKPKHEYGLGVRFSSLSYSPKKIIVNENGKSFWLDEISYKFIGVPIYYKYNFLNSKKLNFYLSSMIQPNLMLASDYKFIQNDIVSGSLVKLAEELLETNDFKNTLYAAKEYKNGTLEGGKSNENFNLSMSVGLGMQTEIYNSYSFFIEPVLNFTILKNDFGPNHDKLSFLSLKFGINKTIDL